MNVNDSRLRIEAYVNGPINGTLASDFTGRLYPILGNSDTENLFATHYYISIMELEIFVPKPLI